jgi:hypothetical protein
MARWSKAAVEREDRKARMIAFGTLGSFVIAVVYTWRGETCRIISARRATNNETKSLLPNSPQAKQMPKKSAPRRVPSKSDEDIRRAIRSDPDAAPEVDVAGSSPHVW